jgi:FMN phosphatase YigB (HAD superfamily)
MQIEALLFDLGKVLVDFDMETSVGSMIASCGIPREEFEEVFWDEKWLSGYERGDISSEEFHRYLCDSGGLEMDFRQFCESWSSVFRPGVLVSESLLKALGARYPLILVSNTNPVHASFIRHNYTVFNHFEHLVLSHEVGSLKPDRRIYEHAVAASGKPADKLFFTDDREENIVAAREMGIHAHRFVSEARLVEALKSAGVQF